MDNHALALEEAGSNQEGFSWESRYTQSWDILQEDSTGNLLQNTLPAALSPSSEYLRRRRAAADAALRRSIMRHLVLFIDWSQATATNEVSPNRAVWIVNNCVKPFLIDFFEQNPLAQLCILALRDGEEIARCPSCSLMLRVIFDEVIILSGDMVTLS